MERKRIWIPEAPFVLPQRPTRAELVLPKIRLRGIFSWELYNLRTHKVERRGRGDNIITNAGLNALGAESAWNNSGVAGLVTFCGVGTGTNAEAATDVVLGNQLIRTNNAGGIFDESGGDGANIYNYTRRTRVFTQAEANGNLTEVGMFSASTGGTMFCRQLLRDELGSPTTIVKTSDYELRITYELRLYHPGDVEYSFLIDGVARNVRTRAAHFGVRWGPLGNVAQSANGTTIRAGLSTAAIAAVTSYPSTGLVPQNHFNESNGGRDAYVASSYQLVYRARWLASVANDTAFQSITTGTTGGSSLNIPNLPFQHQLLDGFTVSKNNLQRFDLEWILSWGRYTP